jgi:formylglycine-generating enzyme required for sulfatase activity/energy-coupling factor transporter ATP-binding protein EcfA2
MEDFGAVGTAPADLCRRKVAESDVFVGLVGLFNGSFPVGSDLSYTQIEYEEAKKRRKTCLMFMTDDDFCSPARLGREPDEVYQRQLRFREQVSQEQVVEFFHEQQRLATMVATALQNYLTEQASEIRRKESVKPKGKSGRGPSDLASTERLYLAHLVARHRYLEFKGMGISKPPQLPLLDMYVPLKARIQTSEGETWARQMHLVGRHIGRDEAESIGERLSEPEPVLGLLRRNDGLVLLGGPGSGKTTFLKWLAVALASGQEESLGLGSLLPVLIPLSTYANANANVRRDVPLQAFISRYVKNRGFNLPLSPLLTEKLARGEVLILLDGLDEVQKPKHRNLVVGRVKDFYSVHHRAGNKFVMTSRVGYRDVWLAADGFAEATLVDFDYKEIKVFIDQWTAALEKVAAGDTKITPEWKSLEKEKLLAIVRSSPGVRSLAANPLLLTILAQGVDPSGRRVKIYQHYTETLIKHWNLARSLADRPVKDFDLLDTLRILQPLALWMHETSPGIGVVKEKDLLRELQRIFDQRKERDPERTAQQFLEDIREYTSLLLLDQEDQQYSFIHLMFRDYLAAAALAQKGQQKVGPIVSTLVSHAGEPSWREVSLLTLSYLSFVQQREQATNAVLMKLLQQPQDRAGEAVILAGEAVIDMGRDAVAIECRERVALALVHTMRDDRNVKPHRRAAAGRALSGVGDPRPEAMTVDGMELCWVPSGPFLMGSREEERDADDDEKPQFECSLSYDYWAGRYPVTVAQYSEYAAETGKRLPLSNQQANEPVLAVTWYEAVEFCRWLTARWRKTGRIESDWEAQLPSEAEWEKAARGGLDLPPRPVIKTGGGQASKRVKSKVNPDPERHFPWGSRINERYCNYGDLIGRVNGVGCFPSGVSPYGVEELSGNVREWTRSLWGEDAGKAYFRYPYTREDGREDLEASAKVLRVLRGGAFGSSSKNVRCAFRFTNGPGIPSAYIGFRVVLTPFSFPE